MCRHLFFIVVGLWGVVPHVWSFQSPERTIDFQFVEQSPGVYRLEPQLPALIPTPGAQPPFWRLFWELGDGNFSFEHTPTYSWADTGTYEVRLWATGAYDNGRPPRDRPKHKRVRTGRPSQYASAFPLQDVLTAEAPGLAMQAVREPVPQQALPVIVSYANTGNVPFSGQLYLFFNEQVYTARHFDFREAHSWWGEQEIPPALAFGQAATPGEAELLWASLQPITLHGVHSADALRMLAQAQNDYREAKAWYFADLLPGEKRNMVLVLEGTSQMLADTNATIHMRAVMVPEQGMPQAYDLEMSIATGNDPNRLSVRNPRRSYRRFRKQHFDWRIQFQNDGKGPVERVQLDMYVQGMDTSDVRIKEVVPQMSPCTDSFRVGCYTYSWLSEDHLQIVLHRIYLPGSRQEGVHHYDSTRGHVKLRLFPQPHWPKRPIKARAEIVFDKEPPMRTNRARVRFKPGLSPALMFGWQAQTGGIDAAVPSAINGGNSDVQAPLAVMGLAFAPFKPRRAHWQFELWRGQGREKPVEIGEEFLLQQDSIYPQPGANFVEVHDSILMRTTIGNMRHSLWRIVPLHLRYNLTSWLSVGAGAELTVQTDRTQGTVKEVFMNRISGYFYNSAGMWQLEYQNAITLPPQTRVLDERLTQMQINPFVDLQVLSVRWGPAVGLRASYQLKETSGREWRWMLYGQWRF